jgi:uncharacterized membrane protein YgdD (TMEM256/DUF423 family)
MQKSFAVFAAFSLALAIILGALGAHALEQVLSPEKLDSFKTGVRYQVWHSLAILIVQLIPRKNISDKMRKMVCSLFAIGMVAFSFSIYLLNLQSQLSIESLASVLGPVTPIGGLLLISGWIMLGVAFIRRKSVSFTLSD